MTDSNPVTTEQMAVDLAKILFPDGWGFVEIESIKDALEKAYQDGRRDGEAYERP